MLQIVLHLAIPIEIIDELAVLIARCHKEHQLAGIFVVGEGIITGIVGFGLHHQFYLYIGIVAKEGTAQYAETD